MSCHVCGREGFCGTCCCVNIAHTRRELLPCSRCSCENPEPSPRGSAARYVSKPSEVEAIQWTGKNIEEVVHFIHPDADPARGDHLDQCSWGDGPGQGMTLHILAGKNGAQGMVDVPIGHYIVRQPGDLTDYWPVDPDYFHAKYNPIEE